MELTSSGRYLCSLQNTVEEHIIMQCGCKLHLQQLCRNMSLSTDQYCTVFSEYQRKYISDRRDTGQWTAPAMLLQRIDSPNLSPPALSDGQAQYTADRVGRGWVSQIFVRRWRVLSLLSLVYSLGHTFSRARTSLQQLFSVARLSYSLLLRAVGSGWTFYKSNLNRGDDEVV